MPKMPALHNRPVIRNWPQKVVALVAAVIIWFLVNETLTTTRTIPGVPVRIINLPANQTVEGLLPNGILTKRVTLTISGKKALLKELEPTNIAVVVNADGRKESWISHIDRRMVHSTDPQIELRNEITDVSANDLMIRLSPLVTDKIPVIISKPIGAPPEGYQFLDVWPRRLVQTISGPKSQIEALKKRGLVVTFNLNRISKSELDALQEVQAGGKPDEVSFLVPSSWKQVAIPFLGNAQEALNDPRSRLLRIDFLKRDVIPINEPVPITVFYPLRFSNTVNPKTFALAESPLVKKHNGLAILNLQLAAQNVSRLFLDVVKGSIEITVVALPKTIQRDLDWTVTFIDAKQLEEAYIKRVIEEWGEEDIQPSLRDEYLRTRFRGYMRAFELYRADDIPLKLEAKLNANSIQVKVE